MTPLKHVMILASAGSGKTFALTNRFVELLAAGAAPERIVALTFTRKAAGEFFDEILQKLARAAADETEARRLASDIGQPYLGRADFLRMLRTMIDAMHRLRLGTLDSFFARIARAFPLELGLAGQFELLQEHAQRLERTRVLRRMFARGTPATESAQADFIEAFKRATFGAEEKQLGARLDAFLDEHQEHFLAAPDAEAWGSPARIWPAGARWFGSAAKLAEAIRELRDALGTMTDGQRARWENGFAALEQWIPGAPLPAPVEYLLKNTLAAWEQLCCGSAEIVVDRRKVSLSPAACRALERIVTRVIGAELERRLEMTRGIFEVLRSYDTNYDAAVRRAGRLTFSDVQRLLQPVRLQAGTRGEGRGAKDEGRGAGDEGEGQAERRLLLDYRLDAEIDHWLLDEFQDTSFGQWSILRNLIDEVVQDPEGRRSFFCVGDVKQAIYAWREGDPRLFREIFHHYNSAAPGSIDERHLFQSWRSGPALVEMVNAVFGKAAAISGLFPGEASAAWNGEWRDHVSAVPQRGGQAAWLYADEEADRWETVLRLITEIDPVGRGLSCAILVKRNRTAAALAEFLRAAQVPAIAESDLHVATDNPVGAVLLALAQAAAHPGDSLAAAHVAMAPLGEVLAAHGIRTPEALSQRVLGQIHADGFEGFCEFWWRALEPGLPAEDAFSRLRAQEFIAAATTFDAAGSRNVDEFIGFMQRHAVRPPESPTVVRVMTVHKSKGLGFDVVFLPDLEGNRIDERREGLAVQKAADRSVDWILDLPPRLFCGPDPVLSAHLRAAEAEACYENLSLLYVAMTRAKRAMYVVTTPPGGSTSRNYPRLLAETLGSETMDVAVGTVRCPGGWSSGAAEWFSALAAPRRQAETGARGLDPVVGVASTVRRVPLRPSGDTAREMDAAALFATGAAATDFGAALHGLLADVEWATNGELQTWEKRWTRAGHERLLIEAALGCLASPDLQAVWRRPDRAANVDLWRERPFEIVLDGAWVTGVFDRVIVEPDRVTVFDFKTDRVDEAGLARTAERYRGQLGLYRRAAAVLAGVSLEKARAEVIFTRLTRRVALA